MSTNPRRVLVLGEVVHRLEQATGVRTGFPTTTNYARFRHVVELGGLCREKLGDFRFGAAHRAARGEAVRLAPLAFLVEQVRGDPYAITGYEFSSTDAGTATVFRDAAPAAMRARACCKRHAHF